MTDSQRVTWTAFANLAMFIFRAFPSWEVLMYYYSDSDLMVMSMMVVMVAVVPIAKAVEGKSSTRFISYLDGSSP